MRAPDVIQTCQARPPLGPFERGCNVTRCDEPVTKVIEVGGGHAFVRPGGERGENLAYTLVRLCARHARELRAALR